MMTELEALIATKCSTQQEQPVYTFSHPLIFDGAQIKIRPLSTSEYYYLIKVCTKDGVLDAERLACETVATCLVDPNLRKAELMDKLGCMDMLSLVPKVFPQPGVLRMIRNKIEALSGFNADEAEFQQCEEADIR